MTNLEGMPRDTEGNIIPDGKLAYNLIHGWYEGESSQTAMAQFARTGIRECKLHKNGNTGTYISKMVELFHILEDAKEPMTDRAKIDALLAGIEDRSYDMIKTIVGDNYNLTFQEAMEKLRREELKLLMSTKAAKQQNMQVKKGGARGRGGGRGSALGRSNRGGNRSNRSNQAGRSNDKNDRTVYCYVCGQKGHLSYDCPKERETEGGTTANANHTTSSDSDLTPVASNWITFSGQGNIVQTTKIGKQSKNCIVHVS
ncbi:MAG: hypothetical protein ACRDL7_13970 [Gaiellaceae bacterium]